MLRVWQAEWIRLRQRTVLLSTFITIIVFCMLFTAVTLTLVLRNGSVRGSGNSSRYLSDFTAPTGPGLLYSQTIMIVGLISASLAAAQVASNYTTGTLRTLLLREPRRIRLLVGHWLAIGSYTVLIVLSGVASVTLTAYIVLLANKVGVESWTSTEGWKATIVAALNLVLSSLGWATVGMALGIFFRSSIVAISVGAAYGLLEGVIASFTGGVFNWFPGQALAAVASGGSKDIGYATALLAALMYLSIAALTAIVLFIRRDVTE